MSDEISYGTKLLIERLNSQRGEARLDANDGLALENQLEDLSSKVYADLQIQTKARMFIPVSGEGDPGAESLAYTEETEVGSAKIISNYADDPPTSSLSRRKVTLNVEGIGGSMEFSLQDARNAAKAGIALSSDQGRVARRAWERKLDDVAAFGSPDNGLGGFLNNTSVSANSATTGAWTGGVTTPAQILTDINEGSQLVVTQSEENYMPNRLLLPLAQYMHISQTRMAADVPETILQAVLSSNPWLTSIDPWNLLSTAGAGSTARAVFYFASPEICELRIPQEFEVLPVEVKGFGFRQLTHGRTAGTAVYRPLGMTYMDDLG